MQVPTISMDQEKAKVALKEYREAVKGRHTDEDEAIMRGYRELAKGNQLLNLDVVMKEFGMNHNWEPRLAICRADAKRVFFQYKWHDWIFSIDEYPDVMQTRRYVRFDLNVFEGVDPDAISRINALVPIIPPRLRPKAKLSNFHILWEAKWKRKAPKDPLLLRRIAGPTFVILAEWDLTELERSVISKRFGEE